MVAELTAWILLKALFFSLLICGPIALVVLAAENRLKKTAQGADTAAVIKFAVVIMATLVAGVRQDWERLRSLAKERRQARVRAEAEDAQPSEFRYEAARDR